MAATITRKTDYASRVVLDLAMRPPGSWTTTGDIAGRRLIPPQLVRQVITQLVRAGLLRSRRGAAGGVSLARPPSAISLLDVVRAVEGPFLLNVCIADPQVCPLMPECPVHEAWVRAQEALDHQLRGETFDALAQKALRADEDVD